MAFNAKTNTSSDIADQRPVFVFGVFELDLRAGELRKHGLKIKLQDQPLQILILLLEHAGEVVSREQIQAKLWAADTHVDYENAINSAVRKLREALGDTAENPRFVETLARRGYRFVAPVSRKAAEGPAPRLVLPLTPKPTEVVIPSARGQRWWIFAIALPTLAAGLVAATWLIRGGRAPTNTQLTPAVPLTGSPGAECCPSFSPDGSRVVFSGYAPSQYAPDIFVKLIGPGDSMRLTENPLADTFPAWSPDGRWIAFLRAVDDQHAMVILMPSVGGTERELTTINLMVRDYLEGPPIAWSPDGKHLFTVETSGLSGTYGIIRVAVDTAEKLPVTTPPPGTVGDAAPSVSPDGSTLAFTRIITKLVSSDIYLQRLSGGLPAPGESITRITFDAKLVMGHAWSADGRELIFSSDRGGRVELWRVTAFGSGKPVRLTGAGESNMTHAGRQYLAVSRQGHRLVYTQATVTSPIFSRVEIADHKARQPMRMAWSIPGDYTAQYSPDGKKIAFQSKRSGRSEIWTANEDGSGAVQLSFSENGFSGTPRWSPDGRSVAFDSSRAGTWDIYVVNAQGGKSVALTTDSATDAVPSWSRDGKFVYFVSTRSGRDEIWKTPVIGGPAIQVTKNGGFMAFESADGRDLYYTKTNGIGALWRMPTAGGDETQIVPSVGGRDFAVMAGRIYFIQTANAGPSLRLLELATGEITTLASLGQGCRSSALTVSPDERWIMYSQDCDNLVRSQFGSRLMLVENFR